MQKKRKFCQANNSDEDEENEDDEDDNKEMNDDEVEDNDEDATENDEELMGKIWIIQIINKIEKNEYNER